MLLEFEYTLNFLIERQKRDFNKLKIIGNNIRKGFIGLALQNEELLNWNDQLIVEKSFTQLDLYKFKKYSKLNRIKYSY